MEQFPRPTMLQQHQHLQMPTHQREQLGMFTTPSLITTSALHPTKVSPILLQLQHQLETDVSKEAVNYVNNKDNKDAPAVITSSTVGNIRKEIGDADISMSGNSDQKTSERILSKSVITPPTSLLTVSSPSTTDLKMPISTVITTCVMCTTTASVSDH